MGKEDFYPPYRYFICPECDKEKEISPIELLAHLRGHGITETKGTKELMLHISKKPRHCASYEWTIGGKTFYEYYG